MVHPNASYAISASKSHKEQKGYTSYYVWFIVDLTIMILTTVGVFTLITKVGEICTFFSNKDYLIYILLPVSGVLLFLFIFVKKIQSHYVTTRLLLGTVVLLWSVSLAIVFISMKWEKAAISLGVTCAITMSVLILVLKLSPLNVKGFIVFISIALVIAGLAIVAEICYYFLHKTGLEKKISCYAAVVLIELFLILVMFTCVSVRKWLIWWFAPQSTEFILAFIVWFLMLGLFIETYRGVVLCLCGSKNKASCGS